MKELNNSYDRIIFVKEYLEKEIENTKYNMKGFSKDEPDYEQFEEYLYVLDYCLLMVCNKLYQDR